MTFSTRLRLTLLLAAVLPTILITIIVVVGISEQVKRIEHREAEQACIRFVDLLDNTLANVEKSIVSVADSRSFLLAEMAIQSGKYPAGLYQLPLIALDFLEYTDSAGTVLLSANRPALVGQNVFIADSQSFGSSNYLYVYENDFRGSHQSAAIICPTENGWLYGGIFFDVSFADLAEAVTRSSINFIDKRNEEHQNISSVPEYKPGLPFRQNNALNAVLFNNEKSLYYVTARFNPSGLDAVFDSFITAVGGVTIVSLVIVITAGLYFSSRTRREIINLTKGAMRVASGDFNQPVIAAGENEFSDLADSFNRMMTQLTEYQNRLVMTEKIAAWQTIGRKVAHEVKNPLTPISIAADDLRRSYIENQPEFEKILTECTNTIRNEVDRLKKLINRFSAFAQLPPPEIKEFQLNELFKDISVLYKDAISDKRLVINKNIMRSSMRGDEEQIRQVIINMIKNSFEADSNKCEFVLSNSLDGIEITINDDGSGFPKKIIDEGITPYFSTKEDGSGLGLLICQRIILDHDGSLRLENNQEGGARVIITLPQSHD